MRKIIVSFLTLVLLSSILPAASAKPQRDWNAVKNLSSQATIAVKTTDGATEFGVLVSADDSGIKVLLADKKRLSSKEIFFQRDGIKKVWLAKLRFEENNMAKGGWIGAGAGLGAAFVTAWALGKNGGDACVGCVLFPAYGAGIGALIGAFTKKGHKKGKLIYSI